MHFMSFNTINKLVHPYLDNIVEKCRDIECLRFRKMLVFEGITCVHISDNWFIISLQIWLSLGHVIVSNVNSIKFSCSYLQ